MQWQDNAFVLWVIKVYTVKKVLVLFWCKIKKNQNKTKKTDKNQNKNQKQTNKWKKNKTKIKLIKLHAITEVLVCWEQLLPCFKVYEYPEMLNLG